ncbi:hypothetical protein C0Q70_08085 [Pomacea canaliculata]|uniref:Uncharacterized protein n=1 Tax=Pomacea canaliculata TaxID=400727 RepID=A0A2T7PGU6_POMCA|nr:hypothetical protein C0Q70_08085 [Pomacea canaliculata]
MPSPRARFAEHLATVFRKFRLEMEEDKARRLTTVDHSANTPLPLSLAEMKSKGTVRHAPHEPARARQQTGARPHSWLLSCTAVSLLVIETKPIPDSQAPAPHKRLQPAEGAANGALPPNSPVPTYSFFFLYTHGVRTPTATRPPSLHTKRARLQGRTTLNRFHAAKVISHYFEHI